MEPEGSLPPTGLYPEPNQSKLENDINMLSPALYLMNGDVKRDAK
jgi:hypothetical protein